MIVKVAETPFPAENAETVKAAIGERASVMRGSAGFQAGILAIDSEGSKVVAITVWESEEAFAAASGAARKESDAEGLRKRLDAGQTDVRSCELIEVLQGPSS